MMGRMGLPVLLSLSLSSLGLFHAYQSRSQFYPAMIYIVKSNLLMGIAYFQALVLLILLGNLLKKIFLGTLRASEFESLIDRSWYAVLETFLTFAIFKDNFSDKFVAFFSMLLFLKVFHWLGEVRVNFMEQSPAHSFLFHFRVLSLAQILAYLDVKLISHAYASTQADGDSVQLVFGFEYAVLLTVVLNFFIKYILHTVDLLLESPWHNKPIFMLYAELIIGFIKVVLYSLFILITLRIYTIPLFAIRPMYLNLRALKKTFVGIVSSYQAIYIMDAHYSQATPEQLASADSLCTICRDEMVANATKILPCNHIFHKSCLRSWFQRQQTCPTCRHDVIQSFRRTRQTPPRNNNGNAHNAGNTNNNNTNNNTATTNVNNNNSNNSSNGNGNVTTSNNQGQAPETAQVPINQPPLPPFPAFNPNLFAQMAANMVPPQQLPFPFPPMTGVPPSPQEGGGATSLPVFLPPPPMLPSFRPPPIPPPDFKGLSDEELLAMEGNERANVEARIECLRNIQVLLDAAVLEMQQYSSILSKVDTQSPSLDSETGARPKSTQASEAKEEEDIIQKMDEAAPSPAGESTSSQEDQEEVRRRRLQKFTIPSPSTSNHDSSS